MPNDYVQWHTQTSHQVEVRSGKGGIPKEKIKFANYVARTYSASKLKGRELKAEDKSAKILQIFSCY